MKLYNVIFILAFAVFFVSCREKSPQLPVNKLPKDYTKENLLEMNVALAQKELTDIAAYIDTAAPKMQKTPGGFWYEIKNAGVGDSIVRGDKVKVTYNLRLLDGTLCYTPADGGTKTVLVGHADETKGLDDALLMMTEGTVGDFIIPANLAYGMVGDQKRVGSKKTIIYEILSIEKVPY